MMRRFARRAGQSCATRVSVSAKHIPRYASNAQIPKSQNSLSRGFHHLSDASPSRPSSQRLCRQSNGAFAGARGIVSVSRSTWGRGAVAIESSGASLRASSEFGSAPRWLSAAAAAGEETTMNVPSMGDSITEGTLVEWSKEVGDYVEQDEVLVILETDKVTVEVRAEAAGEVTEHLAGLNDTVEVGAPLVRINTGAQAPEGGSAPAPSPAPASSSEGEKDNKDEGKSPAPAPAPAPSPSPAPAPAPAPSPSPAPAAAAASGDREESRVKMSRMRLRIAERLKDAQNTAAMLTTFQECDMGALIDLRKKHKEEFEKKHGVRLGFMSAFIKASTQALLENPAVNAYIDGGDIVHRNYCDVSVAVASPRGLVVPVIRNAEKMSFAEVEGTLAGLAAKAREDNIALEDMAGGSFTISNGGVFGSLMGTPILNYPQSAILGMHATKPRPVVVDGKVEIRPMMYLALTYDHRLIDGREAVTFLKSVSDKISDPARLLLEL